MKKILFSILLGFCTYLSSNISTVSFDSFSESLVQLSIPKCGTYFLKTILGILTGRKDYAWKKNQKPFGRILIDQVDHLSSLDSSFFWRSHLRYTSENLSIFKKNKCKICFIYRDPRDHVVSRVYYFRDKRKKPEFLKRSHEECITLIIAGDSIHDIGYMAGVNTVYRNRIGWKDCSDVFAIRFEDIIGARGGGSDEKQLKVMHNLATYLEIDATDEELKEVVDKAFGKGKTFRKGCIGDWKKHFTPEHKELFKEVAGQLLIDLGYEQDFNW